MGFNKHIAVVSGVIIFGLVGCNSQDFLNASGTNNSAGGGTSTGTGTSTAVNPALPAGSPLGVTVQTSWTDDTSGTLTTFLDQTNIANPQPCAIPSGTPQGATPTEQTCTMYIPEGQLFYSNLKISVSAGSADDCALLVYTPYYYRLSTSATYTPAVPNSASIDCSGTTQPVPTGCFDGPGTTTTGFPTYVGNYFTTDESLTLTETYASGDSFPKTTNAWVANDLPASQRGMTKTIANGNITDYAGSTMVDYSVECRDIYNQVHSKITFIISDNPIGYNPPPTYIPSFIRSIWINPNY